MHLGPSVKKFKKIVSQRNMVVLGVNNPHKKDSIANRWGKTFYSKLKLAIWNRE